MFEAGKRAARAVQITTLQGITIGMVQAGHTAIVHLTAEKRQLTSAITRHQRTGPSLLIARKAVTTANFGAGSPETDQGLIAIVRLIAILIDPATRTTPPSITDFTRCATAVIHTKGGVKNA